MANEQSTVNARLAHVCIESTDLDATEEFYALLGLQRRFEFRNQNDDLVGFYLEFDDRTYIEVIKVTDTKKEGAVKHFAIEVDDIDETFVRLSAAGVAVTEKVLEGDKTWMITCNDPSGVYIEIQSYTDESMQLRGGTCAVNYEP